MPTPENLVLGSNPENEGKSRLLQWTGRSLIRRPEDQGEGGMRIYQSHFKKQDLPSAKKKILSFFVPQIPKFTKPSVCV